jgi:S-adenosylmethionine decarboxylase
MLGSHLLIDLYECNETQISDLKYIQASLERVARLSGSQILEISSHEFSPQGITLITIVSNSHFSFHSWPEYHFAALDLFICSGEPDVLVLISSLKSDFSSAYESYTLVRRGVDYKNNQRKTFD